MNGFRYKLGDRPLDGYTIQRPAGRGGFGEVYYALSDSGREVALKVIAGFEQIELRGVGQCMNLKSPHLVTIFDVRHNADGIPFVIMEYVAGPSLRQIIDESPAGLGTQKAAFFLREIGKGLTYLHDCGIVHRDLKPGNIFFENGYVKIGDYGLSKAMSASQHSGQTVTVGTVHYMAPEIGVGRYDKGIDIYALGACLYEMLTGQPPFIGASPGEILIKHMSAAPDVSGIEEPFATVIRRSMAKDPAERYQSVQEMVEAVFGAEHVRQSMSAFSPDDLSMVAGRVAARMGARAAAAAAAAAVGAGVGGSSSPPYRPAPSPPPSDAGEPAADDVWTAASDLLGRAEGRFGRFRGEPAPAAGVAAVPRAPSGRLRAWLQRHADPNDALDPIPLRHRWVLAAIAALVMSAAAGMLAGNDETLAFALLATFGATVGIGLGRRIFLPHVRAESWFLQHLALGGPAMALAMALATPALAEAHGAVARRLAPTWIAVGLALLVLNHASSLAASRKQRVDLGAAIWAGACGTILAVLFGGYPSLGIGVLAGSSLASQVAAPMAAAGTRSRRRGAGADRDQPAAGAPSPPTPPAVIPSPAIPPLPPLPLPMAPATVPAASRGLAVHPSVRWLWLALSALCASLGIILTAAPAFIDHRHSEEEAIFLGFGVGLLFLGLTCFLRSFTRTVWTWWGYLIKPVVRYACVQSILMAAIFLGIDDLRGEDAVAALFFIVFPAMLLLILFFVPGNRPPRPAAAGAPGDLPPMPPEPPAPPAPPASESAHGDAPITTPTTTSFAGHSVLGAAASVIGTASNVVGSATNLVLVTGAVAALLLAMFAGLAAAVDVPGFVGAGLGDARDKARLDARFGDQSDWPNLFRMGAFVATHVAATAGVVLLLVARRKAGPAHMTRAVVGAACLLASLVMLDEALRAQWKDVAPLPALSPPTQPVAATFPDVEAPPRATQVQFPARQVTPQERAAAINAYLKSADAGKGVFSLILLAGGLVVLFWTPSRQQPGVAPAPPATRQATPSEARP